MRVVIWMHVMSTVLRVLERLSCWKLRTVLETEVSSNLPVVTWIRCGQREGGSADLACNYESLVIPPPRQNQVPNVAVLECCA
jgi:hypothetical protein